MKRTQILLDMDGVLADFISGALLCLNRDFNKTTSIKQYVKDFGQWEVYDYYGITVKEFWESIHNTPDFWYNLKPTPWAVQLYKLLESMGDVTIVTTPSEDPDCYAQKARWLRDFGIDMSSVFMGSRKYLMAGSGILIDDYYKNVNTFKLRGGQAILIPSNWNTNGLTFERIKDTILTTIENEF
jgi:5'(3')-deoxyribonucleotidase